MGAVENTVEFRALATELLLEFGTPMDWKVKSGGSYDPTTGKKTGDSTTTHSGVLTSPPVPVDVRLFDEDVLRIATSMVAVDDASMTFVPDVGNVVVFDGGDWGVLAVASFYPGASAAAHFCAVRKG